MLSSPSIVMRRMPTECAQKKYDDGLGEGKGRWVRGCTSICDKSIRSKRFHAELKENPEKIAKACF